MPGSIFLTKICWSDMFILNELDFIEFMLKSPDDWNTYSGFTLSAHGHIFLISEYIEKYSGDRQI